MQDILQCNIKMYCLKSHPLTEKANFTWNVIIMNDLKNLFLHNDI